jgi:hypothetical protein
VSRLRATVREEPGSGSARPPVSTGAGETRMRRYLRRVAQRVAALLALLILFYATSLHGISSRTFVLAGVLVLFLYWVFKGVL